MKQVKNDWRSSLSNAALSDLLRIMIDGPSLEDFCTDQALETWWNCGERSQHPNFQRHN